MQNYLVLVIFMHTNGFKPYHMSAQKSHLYGFTEVIQFIVCIKKLLRKNCLHAVYLQLMLSHHVTTSLPFLEVLVVLSQFQMASQWI